MYHSTPSFLRKLTLPALATLFPLLLSAQKFEGLAQTPPMGWNSWNTFESAISESLVKETAQAMIANGMRDAGYTYIVLDDCWALRQRDAEGNLVADPEKFPSGMKALADHLHERGFKFGIYGDAGRKTCAGFPGSQGHEFQDARTWASWGVDYLKYDWCATGTRDPIEAYSTMRDALFAAGRPVVFSICEWGTARPWEWAQDIGHLWRISGDIYDCWDCEQEWSRGVKTILDLYHDLDPGVVGRDGMGGYAGPGAWNDLDMLEVGNAGLTLAESRSHFTLWAMVGSPLMAGNDVRVMSPEITAIMTNPEVIAINQDPEAVAAWRFRRVFDRYDIWIKPLKDGHWAVCLLNTSEESQEIRVEWERLARAIQGDFTVREIWSGQDLGSTEKDLTVQVASHDVALLYLTPEE